MSLIKFELKDDHIKLLKHIKWSMNSNTKMLTTYAGTAEGDDVFESITPFGGDDLIEDMAIIIYGKPEVELDPFNSDDKYEYSKEQKDYLTKLFDELPTALDIILYTQKFESGRYKTKSYLRDWIKY